jgi:hypothetical protein
MADPTFPTERELAALDRCLERARGCSGGESRVRRLLFAWWNARELGGFDLADLWSLDHEWRADALAVIGMIARGPCGWYADHYGRDRGARMRQLVEKYGPRGDERSHKCRECGEQVRHWCDAEGYRRQQEEIRAEAERELLDHE